MTKPLKPEDLASIKRENIPPQVIDAFNRMVSQNWDGTAAVFKQDDVVKLISGLMLVDQAEIFAKRWLDVEEIFEEAGWKIAYDKPGHNENFPATFTFEKKR